MTTYSEAMTNAPSATPTATATGRFRPVRLPPAAGPDTDPLGEPLDDPFRGASRPSLEEAAMFSAESRSPAAVPSNAFYSL
ncbi:hypothetical protein Misp02_70030 [Microtetraspora sp. NBRC 16547]|nr:hypothetical protein Misp02_70030 [Microtetraspora sp. NBRC 16547]